MVGRIVKQTKFGPQGLVLGLYKVFLIVKCSFYGYLVHFLFSHFLSTLYLENGGLRVKQSKTWALGVST